MSTQIGLARPLFKPQSCHLLVTLGDLLIEAFLHINSGDNTEIFIKV